MGFEVYKRGSAPPQTAPTVTIQKRGLFSLNPAANALIEHPDALQFLWDKDNRFIGLRPCSTSDPNAYPTRSVSQGAAAKDKAGTGTVLVAGTLFTRHIGLDTTHARRWVPRLDEGMLVIDLNEEGQEVISNRNKAKHAAALAEQDPSASTGTR